MHLEGGHGIVRLVGSTGNNAIVTRSSAFTCIVIFLISSDDRPIDTCLNVLLSLEQILRIVNIPTFIGSVSCFALYLRPICKYICDEQCDAVKIIQKMLDNNEETNEIEINDIKNINRILHLFRDSILEYKNLRS